MSLGDRTEPKSFTERHKQSASYKHFQQQKRISDAKKLQDREIELENERKNLLKKSRERSLKRIQKVSDKVELDLNSQSYSENMSISSNKEIFENFHVRRGKPLEDDMMSIASRPENMNTLPAHLQYPASDLNVHEAMHAKYKLDKIRIEKVQIDKSTPEKRTHGPPRLHKSPPTKIAKSTPIKSRLENDIQSTSNDTYKTKNSESKFSTNSNPYNKNFHYYNKFRTVSNMNSKLTKKIEQKNQEIENLQNEKKLQKIDFEKRIEVLEGLLKLAIKN